MLFRSLSLDVVQGDASENLDELLGRYLNDPAVEYAEPDYIVRIGKDRGPWPVAPDDPMFDRQWSLQNVGQTGGTSGADIYAARAWHKTTGD